MAISRLGSYGAIGTAFSMIRKEMDPTTKLAARALSSSNSEQEQKNDGIRQHIEFFAKEGDWDGATSNVKRVTKKLFLCPEVIQKAVEEEQYGFLKELVANQKTYTVPFAGLTWDPVPQILEAALLPDGDKLLSILLDGTLTSPYGNRASISLYQIGINRAYTGRLELIRRTLEKAPQKNIIMVLEAVDFGRDLWARKRLCYLANEAGCMEVVSYLEGRFPELKANKEERS